MYKPDNESLTYFRTIKDRRILLDAIYEIQETLNNPQLGGYQNELWCSIQSIIDNLKKANES